MNGVVTQRTRVGCDLSHPGSTTGDMSGISNTWEPAAYLRHRHPDVRVVEADLPGSLMGCVDHEQRIIWLSRGLDDARRRSTLAFEVGQLEQGPTPANPCLARAQQRAAEEWAALMLIPSELFASAWQSCLDFTTMAAYVAVDVPTFRARIRAASDADQDAAMEAIARSRLSPA